MKLRVSVDDIVKNIGNTLATMIGTTLIIVADTNPEQLHSDPLSAALIGTLLITAGFLYSLLLDGCYHDSYK